MEPLSSTSFRNLIPRRREGRGRRLNDGKRKSEDDKERENKRVDKEEQRDKFDVDDEETSASKKREKVKNKSRQTQSKKLSDFHQALCVFRSFFLDSTEELFRFASPLSSPSRAPSHHRTSKRGEETAFFFRWKKQGEKKSNGSIGDDDVDNNIDVLAARRAARGSRGNDQHRGRREAA